jgi:hypothetical protein
MNRAANEAGHSRKAGTGIPVSRGEGPRKRHPHLRTAGVNRTSRENTEGSRPVMVTCSPLIWNRVGRVASGGLRLQPPPLKQAEGTGDEGEDRAHASGVDLGDGAGTADRTCETETDGAVIVVRIDR